MTTKPSCDQDPAPRSSIGRRLCLRATIVTIVMVAVLGGFQGSASAASSIADSGGAGTTSSPEAIKDKAPLPKPAPVKSDNDAGTKARAKDKAKAGTAKTSTSRPPTASTDTKRSVRTKPLAATGPAPASRKPNVRRKQAPAGVPRKAAAKPGPRSRPVTADPVKVATAMKPPTASPAPRAAVSTPEPETKMASLARATGVAEGGSASPTLEAAAAIDHLATADDFAILAGETITNTGLTTIEGDVGLHPGSDVTGFAPCTPPAPADCVNLTGVLHVTDQVALQAQADLLTAYDALLTQESTCTSVDVALAGDVYLPGVYCSPGTFNLAAGGIITLNALGNPDAQFIFLTGAGGSTLVTGAGSQVILIGGAQACNVYWQVASSATIGVGTAFAGNILAAESIQLQTGATVQGSALAQNGSVTLDTNTITQGPCQTTVIPPVVRPPVVTPPVVTPPTGGTSGRPTSGTTGTRLTSTGLTTGRLRTPGLTTTGRTTTGLTTTAADTALTEQARSSGPSFAATGVSVRTELLVAATAIILGVLLLLLSRLRRRTVSRYALRPGTATEAAGVVETRVHHRPSRWSGSDREGRVLRPLPRDRASASTADLTQRSLANSSDWGSSSTCPVVLPALRCPPHPAGLGNDTDSPHVPPRTDLANGTM